MIDGITGDRPVLVRRFDRKVYLANSAALAAAEHGYDNREYYVDDGENYFNDEYGDSDYYGDGGYVGAEGMHPSLSRVILKHLS